MLKLTGETALTGFNGPLLPLWDELSWAEFVGLATAQAERNESLRSSPSDSGVLDSIWSKGSSGLERPFSQLPCTRGTVLRRVAIARQLAGENDRLLLLGDDDMVSIGLAGAGFRDITALDIDPDVIAAIKAGTLAPEHHVTAFVHDLTDPLPGHCITPPAKLAFIDPSYCVEGIELFLKPATQAIRARADGRIFMSVNLMSLGRSGLDTLNTRLREMDLEVEEIHMGFNADPIPPRRATLINLCVRWMLPDLAQGGRAPLRYFFSDALILKNR